MSVARWLLIFAVMAWSGPAYSQMAIDRLWVDFGSDGVDRSDLVVRNESQDIYYVTVTPSEVVDAGTPDEHLVTYTDPEQLGLLVTPNRLVLNPGELRAIRLVSMNRDLAKDRTYRVDVRPQLGGVNIEEGESENRGVAVKLLAAFNVLVTVRPEGGSPDFRVTRTAEGLSLVNGGSTSMVLLNGKVCPGDSDALSEGTQDHYLAALRAEIGQSDEADDIALTFDEAGCISLPGKRLYPGNSWQIAAADNEFLTFDTRWKASQDLQPIRIQCGANDIKQSESEFCQGAASVAETGAAHSLSPAQQMESEL